MGEVKVSVIIPSFNTAAYVRQCLESVRMQTLSEIEIICVDAGSTDGTAEIIEEYAQLDTRIQILRADRKSYGYQMNLGLSAARGEYIGVVESDDYVTDEMFEKLYSAAHNNKLDFIKSDFYKVLDYMNRRHYKKWKRKVNGNYNKIILLNENPQALVYAEHGNIWSGIYRRRFLQDKNIKFHETVGAAYQDTGFAILCSLEAKRVMFLEDCFYRYRQSREGSSVSSQEKHSHIITEYQWIWEQMEGRGFTDEVSRAFYMAMKLHSYQWNYNRLYPESRKRFLENWSKEELMDFDENLIAYAIPKKDKLLELWKGNWNDVSGKNEEDESKRTYIRKLLHIFKKEEQIVAVCAGDWGKSLLELDRKLGVGKICAVCDNEPSLQGQMLGCMEIISIKHAFERYPNAGFVIANKHYGKDIYEQLIDMGINQKRIYMYEKRMSTWNKLFDLLLLDNTL